MTKIDTTNKVFISSLRSLYYIEKELEKALLKMESASTNEDLKTGFKTHLKETIIHAKRLEEAFKILKVKPRKEKSEGIRGIIAD